MSIYRDSCLAIVLILVNCHGVYGQSAQLSNGAKAIKTPNEPQIMLRLKVFEVVKSRKYPSEIAELSGKRTGLDQVEEYGESIKEIELVKSTARLTQIIDDLTKAGDGKILTETEMMLSPGVQSRYRHGEEIDFAASEPQPNKMIEITDTVEQDATSANPAPGDSIRFAGTTILAAGDIVTDQSVQLALSAKLTAIDYATCSKSPGLHTQSAAATIALGEGRSIILGPWQSGRRVVRKDKIPVLGSLPVIGVAFQRTVTAEQASLVFVLATTEIVQP